MTKEEFVKIYSENPNSDDVMTEINRLYDTTTKLESDFATADSEREKYKKELEEANKRYRERFLLGADETDNGRKVPNKVSFDSLFKDK